MTILMWIIDMLAVWLSGAAITTVVTLTWPVPDADPEHSVATFALRLLALWPFTLAVWAFEHHQAVKAQREDGC